MRRTKLLSFLGLFLIMGLGSCDIIWLHQSGFLEPEPSLKQITYHHKKVQFLAIRHIGLKKYYQRVTETIDSLEGDGYTVFYEQVGTNLGSLREFTQVAKKFRYLTGSFNGGSGFLDTARHQIGARSYPEKYDLINQPNLERLGVDLEKALQADLNLEDLIDAFEAKHGPIILDSCDYNTDLDADYLCKSCPSDLQKDFQESFILGLRNAHLANLIHHSQARKIAVIYGASHWKGLRIELKKIDADWD